MAGDCSSEAVTAAVIGFGGLLNIPEAGMALTALESLLAHHDAGRLVAYEAELRQFCAIKEALALALPSVQGQMERRWTWATRRDCWHAVL
ncbi:hypothetical protein KCP74_08450 [Salmonella enterica subsp. enterica]|nr:hypothetical protein KCP74_08450 [Salmonella enterica subsp. enterica]